MIREQRSTSVAESLDCRPTQTGCDIADGHVHRKYYGISEVLDPRDDFSDPTVGYQ